MVPAAVDRPTLALWARPAWDATAAAFLRVLAGLVANGRELRWTCARGIDAAQLARDGSAEAGRTIESMEALGVVPRSASASEIVHEIAVCGRLLLLAPSPRPCTPALLRIDGPWLQRAQASPDAFVQSLLQAGQVLRTQAWATPGTGA